jgi:hypothetical protein
MMVSVKNLLLNAIMPISAIPAAGHLIGTQRTEERPVAFFAGKNGQACVGQNRSLSGILRTPKIAASNLEWAV